jgi:hypothetical protein
LFPDQKLRMEIADDPTNMTGAHHRSDLAHRYGPARNDRVTAEGGQDDDHEADRSLRSKSTTPK